MAKKNKKKKIITIIVLLVIVILLIMLFNGKKEIKIKETQLAKVSYRNMVTSVSSTGNILSENSKVISSSTMAGLKVETVNVTEGQRINVGDIICTFDTQELKDAISSFNSSPSISMTSNSNSSETISEIASEQLERTREAYESSQEALEKAKEDNKKAEKELKDYTPIYNKKRSEYEPIQRTYQNKLNEQIQAQTSYDTQNIVFENVKKEYLKYFETEGEISVQLNPTSGEVVDKSSYNNGDFATIKHEDVYNRYNKEKEKLEQLEESLNVKKTAVENYQETFDNATSEYTDSQSKYQELLSESEMTRLSVETLQSRVDTLKQNYEELERQVNNYSNTEIATDELKSILNSMSFSMGSAGSSLSSIQNKIDNSIVKSSVSGTITSVGVNEGDTYTGGVIVKIEDCDAFVVEAEIDEYDIPDIKVGQNVKIKTDATRDQILEGKVSYVALAASDGLGLGSSISSSMANMDLSSISSMSSVMGMGGLSSSSSSSNTSSNPKYRIKIDLDTYNERLRIGMSAKISVLTNEKNQVLAIPYNCVHERENGTHFVEILNSDYNVEENVKLLESMKIKNKEKQKESENDSDIISVLADSVNSNKKELDVQIGIEGSYYTEITNGGLNLGDYVIMPEANTKNSIQELINMMGADAGI